MTPATLVPERLPDFSERECEFGNLIVPVPCALARISRGLAPAEQQELNGFGDAMSNRNRGALGATFSHHLRIQLTG